jgi:hypothetical protein
MNACACETAFASSAATYNGTSAGVVFGVNAAFNVGYVEGNGWLEGEDSGAEEYPMTSGGSVTGLTSDWDSFKIYSNKPFRFRSDLNLDLTFTLSEYAFLIITSAAFNLTILNLPQCIAMIFS